ncbi:MAG: DUF2793 domain-containing protein [Verrucomicrobiales bacterium]|nr:DUF2793 domain-containing protein [Verrucomicrobiales bacterium]
MKPPALTAISIQLIRQATLGLFLLVSSLTPGTNAQQSFPTGIDLQGSFVEGVGWINVDAWGVTFDHPAVRRLAPSLGQLMGLDPTTGVAVTNTANLIPLATSSLTTDFLRSRNPNGLTLLDSQGAPVLAINGNGLHWSGGPSFGFDDFSRWNEAYAWGNHAAAGYLTVEREPRWASSQTNYLLLDGSRRMGADLNLGGRSLTNLHLIEFRNGYKVGANDLMLWASAWKWGDHREAGYLITEIDPIFRSSPAASVTLDALQRWDMASAWGNHAGAGYLKTETDPVFAASVAAGLTVSNLNQWNAAYGWGDHRLAGYLLHDDESDPHFTNSIAFGIDHDRTNQWSQAFAWGNHAGAGYLKTETDPVFAASLAAGLTVSNLNQWNTAYGWGDHRLAGYLSDYDESDPLFTNSVAFGIDHDRTNQWSQAFAWGNHAGAGYLTRESDPAFAASVAAGISSIAVSRWNSAFTWGNHAARGYLTAESDPAFQASEARHLTASRTASWDAAATWGDHRRAGYLSRYQESDPVFTNSVAFGIDGDLTNQWSQAYGWGDHGDAGYLKSESDPLFAASLAAGITATEWSHWNTAYGWGNHATAGYLTSESDPRFSASAASGITSNQMASWNLASSWGNHATRGYLTTESDPHFAVSIAANITATDLTHWNTAYGWGHHASAGYLKSETDPQFAASAAFLISSTQISHWNSAFDWGNHADAGYLTSESDPQWNAAQGTYLLRDGSRSLQGTLNAGGQSITNLAQVIFSSGTSLNSTSASQWNTAYGWGNHADAGYLTATTGDARYLAVGGGTLGGDLNLEGNHVRGLPADPSAFTDPREAVSKAYVDSLTGGLVWKSSVLAVDNTPPSSPSAHDRYLVGTSPTGVWFGHDNALTEFDGTSWIFETPESNWAVFVIASSGAMTFTSAGEWTQFSSTETHSWGEGLSAVGNLVSFDRTWGDARFASATNVFSRAEANARFLTMESDALYLASAAASITTNLLGNWNQAYAWGDHASAGYLATESDPVWQAAQSQFFKIDGTRALTGPLNLGDHAVTNVSLVEFDDGSTLAPSDVAHAKEAYSWGDHSLAGYLTTESEPGWNAAQSGYVLRDGSRALTGSINFAGHDAEHIRVIQFTDGTEVSSTHAAQWSASYAWGDHAAAGYLQSESDPFWAAVQTNYVLRDGSRALAANLNLGGYAVTNLHRITFQDGTSLTSTQSSRADTAYAWGNHAAQGYLQTESDPVFAASAAAQVTSGRLSNWNTAYGWGNHAAAGYLVGLQVSAPLSLSGTSLLHLSIPEASATTDGYLSAHDWIELNAKIAGTGTAGYLARFTSTNALATSSIYESNGNVAIGDSTFDGNFPEKFRVDAGQTTSYNVISGYGEVDNYLQLNIHNRSSGPNASSDMVATADNGDESNNYVDVGINSSAYNNASFSIAGPNDAYLYNMGQNLVIGTGSEDTSIKFHTGGTLATHERLRIDGRGHVAIGTTNLDDSALFQVDSTDHGILVPRLTQAQRLSIPAPAVGLLVYQTDDPAGFYYYQGATWTWLVNDVIASVTNVAASSPLVSSGGRAPILSLTPGTSSGQILKWSGTAWTAGIDSNTTYTAGSGLLLSGSAFSLATAGVTSNHLAVSAVTTTNLAHGAVTAAKLASNTVVTSVNGLKDAVTLAAGSGISLSSSGSTITITGSGGGSEAAWSLTGNKGTKAGSEFLGTTDSQPLEFKVDSITALRLEPGADGLHPNLVANSANQQMGASSGSTIGGGTGNQIGDDSDYALISGGDQNQIDSGVNKAVIAGGTQNRISSKSTASVIGGGSENRVQGSAPYATIPGGLLNEVSASYGFAAGRRARAQHSGAFVWGDSTDSQISSTTENQFVVRASGGAKIYSNSGTSSGVSLSAGGNSWSSVSDRNQKHDFEEVDTIEILERLAAIPVLRWRYIWEEPESSKHLGPVAQDFKPAFYPGRDDTSISTLEFDGVALAAIQGLNRKVEVLKSENAQLKAQMQWILERLQALEQQRSSPQAPEAR